jgi:hypothetical protein
VDVCSYEVGVDPRFTLTISQVEAPQFVEGVYQGLKLRQLEWVTRDI